MESTNTDNFAKSSQGLTDKAAEKIQAGIRDAKESVKDAGNALSSKVSSTHDRAAPLIRKAVGRAQSTAQQSFDSVNDIADQARGMVSSAADSVVSYTKRNPVQALAIAAAAGALIYAAMKTFRSYRD